MADVKKKTILDTLKDLEIQSISSSLPFNDPEDDDDIFTSAKVASNDDPNFDDDLLSSKIGSLRNKVSNIEERDIKYFGKKISRKVIENDDSFEAENGSSESDENEESSKHDNSSIQENGSSNGGSDGDDFDEEDYNNDDNDHDDIDSDFNIKIDPSKLPSDLKIDKFTCNADDGIENFNTTKVEEDVRKGTATKLQMELLDKLLESRIRLQKSLHIVNRLPLSQNMKIFASQNNLHAKDHYHTAKNSLIELLDQLLKLQSMLFEKNTETSTLLTSETNIKQIDSDEEITSDSEHEESEKKDFDGKSPLNLPSKRKHTLSVKDYEEEISKRHKVALPYHESVINKWYERTRLGSGKINTKNFSAFDKSTLQQINQVLTDKERLVKRTQLKRTPYRILGENETADSSAPVPDSHLKDYNEQIFDDNDFYHEMLKELIERKTNIGSDDPTTLGRQWLEVQKLRKKIKRKIDTRASKGRKVRYDVHPKLVNFMAPQKDGKMSDQARNDLFSSLFGQTSGLVTR
ncbi:protein AATF isoform X1 [Hydra vulgaris]|uniref:protein AATF isoform X1 n=1 Tax=Hydra vulgaris TaxID=6087 RepID=UPI0001926C5B|nr:protein AATF [Hydra vulgaris]